jgi:signal transduction histidine kinase
VTSSRDEARRGSRILAWSLFAASTVAAAGAVALGPSVGKPVSQGLIDSVFLVVFPLVGALVASRHPRNAVGWIFIAVGLVYGLSALAEMYAHLGLLRDPEVHVISQQAPRPDPLPLAAEAAWLSLWLWFPSLIGLVVFIPLLFPDGRPPSPRWRWVGWAAVVGFALMFLPSAVAAWPARGPALLGDVDEEVLGMRWVLYPAAAGISVIGLAAVGSVASLVVRFRRSRGVERQQLKWFVFAAAILLVAAINAFTPWTAPEWVLTVAIQGIAVAAGIAILKYRLYDIDLVINRSLVYGSLTALVVALYVGTVTLLGRLFEPGGLGVALVATAVVAVLFNPLRDRLQRGVNRLMYGERHDPYAALARLGRSLEASISPGEVLPRITETVAQALRAPYVAVELRRDGGFEPAATHGHRVDDSVEVPLTYQGETVGRLVVGTRGPGERFSAADMRLLADLARQAGVAAHAVRLSTDLQRSRERLVMAREEERRRLRRDLHDGLGPTLAAVALQVETVRSLLREDPAAADTLLAKLKDETQSAIAGIRRIVYDLRPPALDELGLLGALREEGSRFATDGGPLLISVEGEEELPPLPAAVEVAAYRIALEGITNAARHSGARSCVVRIASNGGLDVEIRDDGRGLPSDFRAGVGVTSMRERVAELGGTFTIEPAVPTGTRIFASLPVEEP